MPEGVLAAADPKALYKAYLATLPPDLRAYVEKHKPNDQPATWETVVKLLRSKVEAAEEHSDFLKASDFKSAFSKPGKWLFCEAKRAFPPTWRVLECGKRRLGYFG